MNGFLENLIATAGISAYIMFIIAKVALILVAIIIPSARALKNIEATLMSVDRVHDIAKLQIIVHSLMTLILMFALSSLEIMIAVIVVQFCVMFGFDKIIDKHKDSYVPHKQYPIPVVEADINNCYDIDMEAVIPEQSSDK